MPTIITCPSGLKGEIRGFKVKEANILADRAAMKKGLGYDTFLSQCWLKTIEAGPYPPSDRIDWSKMLVCDRFYTLLRVRGETYGDEYDFKLQCAHDGCREMFEWTVKLSALPFKKLPEESLELFKNGNRFATTLGDGRAVYFCLQTGERVVKAAAQVKARADRSIAVALASRVLEIEGVDANDRVRMLDDLSMADARNLLRDFDLADGGIETEIEIECPHCFTIQEVELPLGRDFFLPREKKTLKPTTKMNSEAT